jgi:dipeptidase E
MRLLLTSAGIKNPSIHSALIEFLGKSTEEASALCIPTGSYGHHNFAGAWRFINGKSPTPMVELGWKSLVQESDVLLVGGGDALYLAHWMRGSGLAELLPNLGDTVWVGLSAGSMVMSPRIGEDFVEWKSPSGGDETLGVVDFSIFPHVDHPDLPENTMAEAERWATTIPNPAYAIDDDTAIKVTDGTVEVVSEGHWKLFTPTPEASESV